MIINLIDQQLFLVEQYIAVDEILEAFNLVERLFQSASHFSDEQRHRWVQFLVKLEFDELFIEYFEAGGPLTHNYLTDLIRAYIREADFKKAEGFITQIEADDTRVELTQVLIQARKAEALKMEQHVIEKLTKVDIDWERVFELLKQIPELFRVQVIYDLLDEAITNKTLEGFYLAFIVDLAAQQQLFFTQFPHVQPIELTPWIIDLHHAGQALSADVELVKQLVIVCVLDIYPHENDLTSEQLLIGIQADLAKMLGLNH